MSTEFRRDARLHEKVVQHIATQALPKVQGRHTTQGENMAQRVSITLVDDLDGSEATETVAFGLDNTSYEVDLSEQNAKELRSRLDEFVAVARKVTGRKRTTKRSADGPAPKDIRVWARGQGMEVSSRGTIPVEIVKAYEAAH